MSDPVWMQHVQWPNCETCRSTGVMTDPATQWPAECTRCKNARASAVAKAQATRRREVKTGEV